MTIAARHPIHPLKPLPTSEIMVSMPESIGVDVPVPKRARPDIHLPFVFEQQDLFSERPNAAYYVGLIAAEDTVYMPETFLAARRLRYDTYNSYGLLADHAMDLDGGEHDDYDTKSAHFGVLKNTGTVPKLIAYSRLILNRDGTVELPVEEDYPEAFDQPSGAGASESSRLVSMSREKKERSLASAALQRAMIGWGVNNGFDMSYAMVDQRVIEQLDRFKIPYLEKSGYKYIPQYNSASKVIAIDPEQALRYASLKNVLHVPMATSMFFRGTKQNQGLGYYGAHLIKRYDVDAPDMADQHLMFNSETQNATESK